MAVQQASCTELNLPWVEGREDRLFKRMVVVLVLLFLIITVGINRIILPEIQQKQLSDVAPRLAKLIVEKKKEPPPPPPKKVKPPEKKKEVKKEVEKPKPKPKKKEAPKPVDKKAAARKKAQQSGLVALQDDLADLRESFDFSDIADKPQIKTGNKAEEVVSATNFLTAKAAKGSGGIQQVDTLNRQLTGSELAQRRTTKVKSSIQSSEKIAKTNNAKGSGKRVSGTRSQEEVERVFQKNKGSIFSIYNRELRKDPSLQGKVIVELTISPDGTVIKCVLVSSELKNKNLERRLVSRIKKFKFASKKVPKITVTYPIEFVPS